MGVFRNHRLLLDLIHLKKKKMHVIYLCNKEQKKHLVPNQKYLVLYKKTQKYNFFYNLSRSRLITRKKLLIHIKVMLISYNLSRNEFVRKVVSLFVRIKEIVKET